MPHHTNSRRLLPSGKRRPCPVCKRISDQDCRMSPDLELVLCHHPRTNLVPWVDGEAGTSSPATPGITVSPSSSARTAPTGGNGDGSLRNHACDGNAAAMGAVG